jgi:hypothetical protein
VGWNTVNGKRRSRQPLSHHGNEDTAQVRVAILPSPAGVGSSLFGATAAGGLVELSLADGSVINEWQLYPSGMPFPYLNTIETDDQGNLYTVVYNPVTGYDHSLEKRDAEAGLLWSLPAVSVGAIAVDAEHNVYVGGGKSTDNHGLLRKLAPDGQQLEIVELYQADEVVVDLAVGNNGRLYLQNNFSHFVHLLAEDLSTIGDPNGISLGDYATIPMAARPTGMPYLETVTPSAGVDVFFEAYFNDVSEGFVSGPSFANGSAQDVNIDKDGHARFAVARDDDSGQTLLGFDIYTFDDTERVGLFSLEPVASPYAGEEEVIRMLPTPSGDIVFLTNSRLMLTAADGSIKWSITNVSPVFRVDIRAIALTPGLFGAFSQAWQGGGA